MRDAGPAEKLLCAAVDVVAQSVFLAVLLGICGGAEWLLAPAAYRADGAGGAAFVVCVLTLAALGAVLLCAPRSRP